MAEELLSTETSGGGDDWDKYKVKATDPSKEDWSKYAVKKKANTVSLPSGVDLSGNGFTPSPSSQQDSQLTPVLPSAQNEVRQQQLQDAAHQQTQFQRGLKEATDASSPELKAATSTAQPTEQAVLKKGQKPTAIQRAKFGLEYALGNTAKGIAANTVAPLYYYANKAGLASDEETKRVLDKINTSDKETFGIKPENLSNAGGITGAVGGLARMVPSLITAEGTGGASFALQNIGDAALQVQEMKNNGVEFKNHSDDLFINGMGLVGLALGRGTFGKVFSKMPSALRNSVTKGVVADAMQELGKKGADATAEDIAQTFMTKAATVPQRVLTHGIDALQTYAKVGTEMSGANIASFGLKNAANTLNGNGDKPFKDVTGEDFVHGVTEPFYSNNFDDKANPLMALANIATSTAGQFGILHGVTNSGMLFKGSPYENPIINQLRDNNSPESVDNIKGDLTAIGKQKGLSDEEIDNTHKAVDMISETVGKLPKQLPKEKLQEGVSLIMGKNELEQELKSMTDERGNLDKSISDIPTKAESIITDKIDQANDKLRSLLTGDRITYSKGTGDDEGTFYKTLGGKKEEISPSRYALENLERESKKTTNEQTQSNTQVPAEQPADEAVGVPKVADQNDATVKVNPPPVEVSKTPVEENPQITVNEVKDKPIIYHGEPADIIQDGQTLIAKIKNSNREYELGNVDEVGDKSIKDLGIEHESSVVDTNEKGNIVVRGKEYVNNYYDPKMAINYDNDGNVVSVNLETPDGSKRAFKGDAAEDIAYQIHLKELNKDNETKQQFEQFIEQHEPSKSAIVAGENEVAAEKGTVEDNAPVSRKRGRPKKIDVNQSAKEIGITEQDVKREKQFKSEDKNATVKKEATSAPQDTGGTAAQGSLSEQEANRLKELRKKFSGQFNDITRIPTMLADKEFREYAGLVFKDTLGDFKAFSKRMVDEVGEKIKEHLPQLFKDLGGEPPKEVVPEESGLNKASVAENRKVIGLKDVNKPEVLDGDQEYRKAAEKVRNGSLSPYDIAEKIIRTRATPTIEEFNALLYQNRVIDNDYESAIGKVEEAEKSGNAADKEDARNQLIVLERNKDLLHNAARNVSYNWGFMGRMLQEAVKKDYTLSNLRSLFRSKADGEIPADIEAKLTQYVKERDEAVKNLQDYQSKEAERAAQVKVDRERRANNRKVTTERLDKAIEDTFASISKKLKAQRATLSMNPIPIEMLPDIGKLVSYYTQKGVIKATDIADNIFSRLKDDIDGLTKKDVINAMAGNGYQKETKPLDELQRQRADVKLQAKLIARLEELESGNVKPSLLKSKRSISDEVQSLRERIKKAAIDAGLPLDNLKKNLQAKLDELEKTIQGIQSGEIEAPKKAPAYKVESDQEALRLKAKVKRAEKLIDELGANLDQRREKNVNKFLDGYTKLHRFFILSRIGTLAKLRAAAMGRQLTTPVEEALGSINRIMPGFRKIAERSPRFSKGFKISAEVKAVSEYYSKSTIKDNNQVLKEGHGELDYLFDPKAQKETEMAGFPGRLHAWLKNSTKRAEWQRSFEHIMQWEKNNDPTLDVNDPAVQERVGKEAYKESRRSIFMNDNMSVDLYNNVLQFAERNWGVTGKAVATAFRALMPIVKIPTNFALEAADYSTLGARAIPTVLKAVFKGAESLSPKEADFVMRMMRKGQLGGAMMAIAYFNPKHFGGYNIPGQKRDKNDLHQGDMVIGDFHVPHLLQHIPLISAMQAAATLRRTRDLNIEKGKEGGTYKGVINGFMGIMENVPFLSAPSELEDALKSDNAFNSYVGSMVKNQVEPGLIQEVAEQTDTKDGSFATINPENAQKRYPDTKDGLGKAITDNLKMGIPGLREQVSGLKASEVDKAVKKIKLPNGPEFELNDAQVKDRQNVNADFIQKNGGRLKAALERKAAADKELLKKIHDRAKVWAENEVPIEEKKKFKQELIDAYVEHHIKLIANKHSMPYIYRKYKKDLKPIDE